LHLAARSQCQNDFAQSVFTAHFEEGLLISDHGVLSSIASKAGLARNEVERLLGSDEFARDVLNDEATAKGNGIERTPHFILNGEVVRVGVQYADDWHETLRQVVASAQ